MKTHEKIAIGIDIGSTTVKAVVCDPDTLEILWSDYQRHETRQPEKTLEFLVAIGHQFPNASEADLRVDLSPNQCPCSEALQRKELQLYT